MDKDLFSESEIKYVEGTRTSYRITQAGVLSKAECLRSQSQQEVALAAAARYRQMFQRI